ncbi:hypothetical protein HSBAA_39860 [Vreelandella sulfidaeris]|uniref:Glucose-6-phosphate isomerase n=1 Tax=Vreelandella sulfidaeris TaxID=115553 RepID=A0A455U916_9GAMM|nr:hypothetical protein HSBAA_39860 [Halomonas sulfidaeris]
MGAHFIAASTNRKAAMEFGIREENVFEFWAWVGGRYSMWSSIGLPIALSIGFEGFIELLEGAHEMDNHFINAPFSQNMPVLMALIGIWYINFIGAETQAIVPYDQALNQLPSFLQQLDMESNGKSVDIFGHPVNYKTGPIVWGQTGSNGQHAFFQLLHQGTRYVPIDFIASLKPEPGVEDHHFALLTNMLAQANAFMEGSQGDSKELSQHDPYSCPGNRPSSTLLLDELTPKNLGALIALYEHKVFVQGVIWNINSFDQWAYSSASASPVKSANASIPTPPISTPPPKACWNWFVLTSLMAAAAKRKAYRPVPRRSHHGRSVERIDW